MRFPVFIPLVLLNLFSIMTMISGIGLNGPAWKFWLGLFGTVFFTITSILAGGAILREGEGQNSH
ncbi:MAG: hypothetical protein ABIX01_16310 [Chitinophagaceae bacterium]